MFACHGEGSWIGATVIAGEIGDWAWSAIEVLANMGFAQLCFYEYAQFYLTGKQIKSPLEPLGLAACIDLVDSGDKVVRVLCRVGTCLYARCL